MNDRRGFLKTLMGTAIGALALEVPDPERLLWTPSAKTIIDMGAHRPALERPSLNDILTVNLPPPTEGLAYKFIAPPGTRLHITAPGLEPIYLPDRFRLTVESRGDRWNATYDSDYRLKTINGQPATDDAIAKHAQKLQRTIRHSREGAF